MKGKLIFSSFITITSSCGFFLVWWKNLGEYSGQFDFTFTDKIALFAGISLVVIFILALFQIKKSIAYIGIHAFILLVTIYCLDLYKSKPMLELHGCDMSVCNTLTLRKDGSFDSTSARQTATTTCSGQYRVSNDTIYLFMHGTIENTTNESEITIPDRNKLKLVDRSNRVCLWGLPQ